MSLDLQTGWEPAIEEFICWFDKPGQTELAHDVGTDAPCPICGDKIGERTAARVKNVSILAANRRGDKCFVYFMHQWCAEEVTVERLDQEIMAWHERKTA